jgi:hypothetical protein
MLASMAVFVVNDTLMKGDAWAENRAGISLLRVDALRHAY